jgi:two-component system phosphate regulon response regulator PhoB
MAKPTILIVDDEEDIRELVRLQLEREHYATLMCETGEQALDLARQKQPGGIILDLMLPGIDGLEVCRKLKQDPRTDAIPIVMLTAKGEESDIVAGLELGADDYVTKPFSGRILLARLRAVLRRHHPPSKEEEVVSRGDIAIDMARREVRVNDEPVKMTFTEFNILHILARRPGVVFTRYKIVDALHGNDYLVTDRAVDVQIVSLRKKLGPCGSYIETVRGVGYRFKDNVHDS